MVSHLIDKLQANHNDFGSTKIRFGLLMPEVSSMSIMGAKERIRPDDIKANPPRKVVKEYKPETAVNQVRMNLYGKDPAVAVDAKNFAACKSVYRSKEDETLGDLSDVFVFANFSSPPKNQHVASEGNENIKIAKRRLPNVVSAHPAQKVRLLLRRPCAGISVSSISTKNMTVKKRQPVSIEIPLPVATRPLTKKIHRGTHGRARRLIRQ